MKNLNLKLVGVFTFSLLSISTFAQNWKVGGNTNAQLGGSPPIIGTIGNNPFRFITNDVQRMHINATAGATSGFVGINETNPLFRLHVRGSGQATAQGWTRGIMMSDRSALMWHGAPNTNRHYFMGHSSNNPFGGNFFQGFAEGVGAGAPVTYASTVFVTTNPSSGPDGSTENRQWFFINNDVDNQENRFGVNTLGFTNLVYPVYLT